MFKSRSASNSRFPKQLGNRISNYWYFRFKIYSFKMPVWTEGGGGGCFKNKDSQKYTSIVIHFDQSLPTSKSPFSTQPNIQIVFTKTVRVEKRFNSLSIVCLCFTLYVHIKDKVTYMVQIHLKHCKILNAFNKVLLNICDVK